MKKIVLVFSTAAVLALSGCADMDTTQQRVLSGAAIGTVAGVGIGALTGGGLLWGAVGGAAVGAAGGYVYDRYENDQEYQRRENNRYRKPHNTKPDKDRY
ncbi:outer membrane protein with glycine zipper [Jezberella montanilacus]|jgi:uncharacterized protein YcfJ|uniref:Outer membrane protein with glycine zipper n=1 Tax=Jezberella montanilacus TaxID=323426 RepID=A0A2T0XBN0_9BURK|nr:glycine zipper domain-containing protein [Jezberella montanilacus]PRY96327.1 outer membrane protein with glycine zipper [Jezberella montanilacus]